jgi:hypothetical protein
MIDKEHIARLKKNRDWLAVEEFIRDKVESLNTLPNTKGLSAEVIAIEVRGREIAVEKLAEILRPFMDFRDTFASDIKQDKMEDAGLS